MTTDHNWDAGFERQFWFVMRYGVEGLRSRIGFRSRWLASSPMGRSGKDFERPRGSIQPRLLGARPSRCKRTRSGRIEQE
jgi:hypothetical protein